MQGRGFRSGGGGVHLARKVTGAGRLALWLSSASATDPNPTAMTTLSAAPAALTLLTDEEVMFREAVREFAATEVRPHVQSMDEAAEFRQDLIPKFFELGLMGIEVPEQYGGSGGTIFMAALAIEELARVDASAAIYVDVHNTLVNNAVIRWGNPEQQARYFPRLTTDLLGAFALSEPGSGSDAFALATRAERRGQDWVLTGRK